jgi:hypothetical protein
MTKKESTPQQLIMFKVRTGNQADLDLERKLRAASRVTGKSMSDLLREATEQRLRVLARRYPEIAAA